MNEGRVALLAVALMGCIDFGVDGNGRPQTETRPLAGFTAVDSDITLDVAITEDATASVVVTTDANLLPLVTTTVTGSMLVIRQTGGINPRTPSLVTVHVPLLTAADTAGSGAMTVTGFSGGALHLGLHGSGALTASVQPDTLDVECDGSGSGKLAGGANGLTLDLAGSGSLDATALSVRDAKASLFGSGSASLVAAGVVALDVSGSGSLRAELDDGTASLSVSGSGSIVWSGNAEVIAESRTGSGSIVHQ